MLDGRFATWSEKWRVVGLAVSHTVPLQRSCLEVFTVKLSLVARSRGRAVVTCSRIGVVVWLTSKQEVIGFDGKW